MPSLKSHPDARVLSDYALGQLSLDELESVADHIDQCGQCQETLNSFDNTEDTLLRYLAGDAPIEPYADEPELAGALAAAAGPEATAGFTGSPAAEMSLGRLRDYELIEPLGRGGMGTVFRARHQRLDRMAAVKVLPIERTRQREAVARFHREMKAVGNLDHPNIVRAFDAGEVDGKHFLAMELVDGIDLSALAGKNGPLRVADACELVRQAAVGLQHAHVNGLIHRDIKPSNLMLDRRGVVKVLDLGLARILNEPTSEEDPGAPQPTNADQPPQAVELTGTDQIMGAPDYMAPEQCADGHRVDVRGDIYSLGATLYRLLSGRAPHADPKYDTLAKKVTGITDDQPPSVKQWRDDVPPALQDVLERLMAKRPEDRPASAADAAELLTPFCNGHQLRALGGWEDPPQHDARPANLRWLSSSWHWTAALFLLVGAAMTIRVATDYGRVQIRTNADAIVAIKKNDRTVKTLELEVGSETVELRSGQYIVQVVRPPSDAEHIHVGPVKAEVRRGELEIVEIEFTEKQPKEDAGIQIEISREEQASPAPDAAAAKGPAGSNRLRYEPVAKVARFVPGKDAPIAANGVKVVQIDGESTWRIDCDDARTVQLFEIENLAVENCIVAYRAKMKTENLSKRAYLEMWCRVEGWAESFSKGFHHAVSGTNGWAAYETPFFLRKGERADLIRLNVVTEGAGTIWIKDVEVIKAPLPKGG